MNIETVLAAAKKNKLKNIDLIKKAYDFALKCHKDQKRETGEPYIQHPLHVAKILADLNLDEETIASGLLHDVLEDTTATIDDLKGEFGPIIATIVDGLTKIHKLNAKTKEEYHAESIRKMVLASAKDIRVILIKLADKLHNMRTLDAFREEKRKRISQDVMDIYAPLAHKLGIASIKWELEDLAFKYLNPKMYHELQEKIQKSRRQREKEVERISAALKQELAKHGFDTVAITGRSKHIYSIYRKMQKKSRSFEEIYDLAALRIIAKEIRDCYAIIGIIHNMWKPIPNEFDDYIAMPKSNFYQSLHTAVIGPNGTPVEVQVRTEEMDKVAESGIAAHWKYKGFQGDNKFDAKLGWLRQVMEWQQSSKDYKDFMEMLQIDFFEDEIFTFTPKGDVIQLPKNATVLDFAYAIHSNVGDHATGGKVNNKFVPLKAVLENGDQVEIVTAKTQHPSREWLKYAITSKAKAKIKQYVRQTQAIPVRSIAQEVEQKKQLEEWIIAIEGVPDSKIKLSKCCSPVPGDQITGFTSGIGKVSIHRLDCNTAPKTVRGVKRKKVKAYWIDQIDTMVEVIVEANNRTGLFAEILNAIVSLQTQMRSANARPLNNDMVECRFAFEARGLSHLQTIVLRVKNIRDVKKVFISPVEKKK
ncbi:bifunctional (p)ppGpp synthetase/guanosine-3',5'-bis(diphosphate) 3'-pyrophosphohydrolase [Candidatus Woesearchaeota archaeon]|nr:bifunctional (p)ppGpp synthetase/guanosine-3',5'-bis(diphosphate) 3'-pyrophosphohydrolase [Candidatus Woesearchaeota archaeon]